MQSEPLLLKTKVHQEIELLPEDKLGEVYELIRTYRLRLESTAQPTPTAAILQLAGSWRDLPDTDFATFMDEIRQRRQQAFRGRPHRGSSPD